MDPICMISFEKQAYVFLKVDPFHGIVLGSLFLDQQETAKGRNSPYSNAPRMEYLPAPFFDLNFYA